MKSLNLNFLKEDEVEAIVSVIEKDFELKAAEKTRICRLRKQLVNRDRKAELISQLPFDGSFCVLCCSRFIIIINPKRICCSCGMQICNNCCSFAKTYKNFLCKSCRQQQDLIAMNCSWFYETIRRKFMEGGSQIVANSLSEYPRKNAISPSILKMVKGAQITKFRHQIENSSSSILDSLRKVEGVPFDEYMKSEKYTELIKRYSENLKIILHNTFNVLRITLENYNKKTCTGNRNIDLQVLQILHEEVELLVGKKINIKSFQETLRKNKRFIDGSDFRENLEAKLAQAILEKLISDHQQFLMENRKIPYDDLNDVLKDIVQNENIDFDYDSISQAPSRHGTIRQYHPIPMIPDPLIEISPVESDDSSKLYSLSGTGERTSKVSKQWNQVQQANSIRRSSINSNRKEVKNEIEDAPVVPIRTKRLSTGSKVSKVSDYKNDMKIDSDVITMAYNNNQQTNWLMNARQPFGSLNSLNIQSNDPYLNWNKSKSDKRNVSHMNLAVKENSEDLDNTMQSAIQFGSLNNIHFVHNNSYINRNKNKVKRNVTPRPVSRSHIDPEFDELYSRNEIFVDDLKNPDLDNEYKKNLKIATTIPMRKQENKERTESLVWSPLTHMGTPQFETERSYLAANEFHHRNQVQQDSDSGVVLSQTSSIKPKTFPQKPNTKPTKYPVVMKASLNKPQSKSDIQRKDETHLENGSNSSIDSDPNNIMSSTRAQVRVPRRGRFK